MSSMMKNSVLLTVMGVVVFPVGMAVAQYQDWKYSGSIHLITTPEGANLPATATELNFPVLIRLNKDTFDFTQAKSRGEDLRVTASSGQPLAYQIEQWDPADRTASIWVRVPVIKGNAHQEIKLHWGKPDATSESNGAEVFSTSNGFVSVWHMDDLSSDAVGTLNTRDTGTRVTSGVIGLARQLPGSKGIFGGDRIESYPIGSASHSTEAWFRPRQPNSVIIGWGNEQGQGKIVLGYRSPPHARIDGYFSDGNVEGTTPIPLNRWVHVVHTYTKGDSRLYVNGVLDTVRQSRATPLSIQRPARLWIGGWYDNYDFVGDIDETRVSNVVRSADWVRLEYESQNPLQTLVGHLVQPGTGFSVSETSLSISEGSRATVMAKAGGAQKVYWILRKGNLEEEVVAVDQFRFSFDAGRVSGDQSMTLVFKAVYADEVKTLDIPITIGESIPEPGFALKSPVKWDGRQTIEVVPEITNLKQMQASGAADLKYKWTVSGLAAIKEIMPGKLILKRAQNSGVLTVTATISNGGDAVSSSTRIDVLEPGHDAWVERIPASVEKPEDNQFYARNEKNEGTLYYNGKLSDNAGTVFLNLFADDILVNTRRQEVSDDGTYAFTIKLKPGLIKYRVEFGTIMGGVRSILHTADNIVCGDAYLITGQSNALATDTRENSPPETNVWVRSYGKPTNSPGADQNLWCNPVWKTQNGEEAELGWWGMELAKRLVKNHQVPIFMINGAVGGTRIDQHQRCPADPTDLNTIYGRLLWRVRAAKLTHGIRAVLWHQGENDQGAAGPDGGYGWETYEQYFVAMSAAWKQDFPNLQHYYIFQIWPNSCSMGNGNGDMLREVQRTLPRLYSNLDIMSTLGIKPPGPCHFPLEGWAEFARLIQPLIERDIYGKAFNEPITPPNLKKACFAGPARESIALEFDQDIVWNDSLINQFCVDGMNDRFEVGAVSGNVLTLKLKQAGDAKRITYLREMSWSQEQLLIGKNGIAALSFCNVPIDTGDSRH